MSRIGKDPPPQTPATVQRNLVSASQYARTAGPPKTSTPAGGSPLPPGKLAGLTMPAGTLTREPSLVSQPQPSVPLVAPVQGVGSGLAVNQAVMQSSRPLSMSEARAAAEQTPFWGQPEEEHVVQPEEPTVSEPKVPADHGPEVRASEQDISDVGRIFGSMNMERFESLQDVLSAADRKKAIEARLKPMAIDELILTGSVQQDVPVIPGKLVYTLRTMSEDEHMFCLQWVYDHPGSTAYSKELLDVCKMTCSLVAINGKVLPDHLDKGDTSKDNFQRKLKVVVKYATELLADLAVQTNWFKMRVLELFTAEAVKNG